MTNELAGMDELVGRLQLGDLAAIPEAVTALQSLTATAREAEALRAESARLRLALCTIQEGNCLAITLFDARMLKKKDRLTWWAVNVLQDAVEASRGTARAALEQGEDAILRAERNEP